MPPPSSKNEFDIGDAERILKSIFPQVGENPLGEILKQTIEIRSEQLAFEAGYDADQAETREKLDEISSRTFGILFLQIIKVLKTLMGLLPAGKVILLAVAAIGLAVTYLETGSVSAADIRDAVERSGLGNFIREQLRILNKVVDDQAVRVEQVIDLGSDLIQTAARKAEVVARDIEFLAEQVTFNTEATAEELVGIVQAVLVETQAQASELANLTSNTDVLIMGALRSVPAQIRSIPTLVTEMLR